MGNEANEKPKLKALNPRASRHTDPPADGNEAGYHRLYRRPRTMMTDECMPVGQADRIEEFDRQMKSFGGYAPGDIDRDGDDD